MSTLKYLDVDGLGAMLYAAPEISGSIVTRLEEQEIDGEKLLYMLGDMEEFKEVLPKGGDRIAIKIFVKKNEESHQVHPQKAPPQVESNVTQVLEDDDDDGGAHAAEMTELEVLDDGIGKATMTENVGHDEAMRRAMPYSCRKCKKGFSSLRHLQIHVCGENEPMDKKSDGERKRKPQPSSLDTPPVKKRVLTEGDTNVPLIPVFDINKISIPHFGRRVQAAIKSNQLADHNERVAFVRECVAHYEPILPHPTEEQYTRIAQEILKKNPCLKDNETNYWATFKAQLMQRYRNNRRTSSGAKMQQLVGVQLAPGIGKPTPSSTVDFVREECEEGIEALQKLFDSRAVESLLDQTRPHRASWLQTAVSIHTVLQTYPVLKHPKWLLHEFKVELQEDMAGKMKRKWEEVCEQVLGIEDTTTFEKEVDALHTIRKNIVYKPSSVNVVEVTPATDDIQKHYDSAIVEPRLVVFTDNGKLSQMLICAEGEELFEAPGNTLIDGIVLLMAAYFVFKFDYPKQCKSLLLFF